MTNEGKEEIIREGITNEGEGEGMTAKGKEEIIKGEGKERGENGYDQIAELIQSIRTNPSSRRHIITAWNPLDVNDVCLPPCHVLYQFHVDGKELSCTMYQRSADLFLGVPFNIASTALLTHLIAKTCDLTPGEMTVYYGNVHIYMSHITQVQEQLSRTPPFNTPRLNIHVKREKLEDYTFDDIKLIGYVSHPAIRAKMAV